jgi:hypothetical protein
MLALHEKPLRIHPRGFFYIEKTSIVCRFQVIVFKIIDFHKEFIYLAINIQ